MMRTVAPLMILIAAGAAQSAGIDELNAQRANLRLPPMIEDPVLTGWAQQKAEWQAAHLVNLQRGYNGHEGPRWRGTLEGTGCAAPEWGWVTCRMRTLGRHRVGCGVALGEDGKRYMCLLIADPGHRLEETRIRVHMTNTSGLSRPPRIYRRRTVIRREPIRQAFTPRRYKPLGPPTLVP